MTVTASPSRPEPVLLAAGVASGLTSLTGLILTVLAAAHVLTPTGASTLGPVLASTIPTVIGAVTTLAAALHARSKVTPLSDPRLLTAAADLLTAGQTVTTAVQTALRPAGPQTPGIGDHAAPEPALAP